MNSHLHVYCIWETAVDSTICFVFLIPSRPLLKCKVCDENFYIIFCSCSKHQQEINAKILNSSQSSPSPAFRCGKGNEQKK